MVKKIGGHFEFILFASFVCFLLPFLWLNVTIDPTLTPRFVLWFLFILLILPVMIGRLFRKQEIDFSVISSPVFIAFGGLFLFTVLSCLKAVNKGECVYEITKTGLSIATFVIFFSLLMKDDSYLAKLIKLLVITSLALSVIGAINYLIRYYNNPVVHNVKATMAQKNMFSTALFLLIPFCGYGLYKFNNYWKIISATSLTLLLLLIVLIQTRSVWLGTAGSILLTAALGAYAFFTPKAFKRVSTKRLIRPVLYIAAVLLIVFGFQIILLFTAGDRGTDKRFSFQEQIKTFSPGHSRNAIRLAMWSQTLEIISDNPAAGVGAGNWKIVFPSYGIDPLPGESLFEQTFYVRPENDYLWILSEIGVLGFLFYLSIYIITFYYLYKIMTNSKERDDRILACFLLFVLNGYLIISFFTFPKERIFHTVYITLILSVITYLYQKNFQPFRSVRIQGKYLFLTVSFLLTVSALVIGIFRFNGELHTRKAYQARAQAELSTVIEEIDKGFSWFSTLDPMATPLKWYRGEANILMGNPQDALTDYQDAYAANPYHIHVLNNLATAYEMTGQSGKAIEFYLKTLELHPNFQDARINLAAAYYNAGHYQEAYNAIMESDRNDKRFREYYSTIKNALDNLQGEDIIPAN